jgi:glutamate racemase
MVNVDLVPYNQHFHGPHMISPFYEADAYVMGCTCYPLVQGTLV